MRARLLVPVAAVLLLAGCSDDGTSSAAPTTTTSSPAATSAEPGSAQAEASREAAADPAAATDASSAALAVALRATDLPAGWTVQANPVPDGDLTDNPSLDGICGGQFPSEATRTAKYPVVGLDPQGSPTLLSEAIAYDSAASAAAALDELRAAFASCPSGDRTVVDPPPTVDGLAENSLLVQYELTGGARQEVVAQARGAVLSVLLAEQPDAAAGAAQGIAGRLAALPAAAIGL